MAESFFGVLAARRVPAGPGFVVFGVALRRGVGSLAEPLSCGFRFSRASPIGPRLRTDPIVGTDLHQARRLTDFFQVVESCAANFFRAAKF